MSEEFKYSWCGEPCHQFPIIVCFAGQARYYGESYHTAEEAHRACDGKHDYFADMEKPGAMLQY
jgi:hypothetical protein